MVQTPPSQFSPDQYKVDSAQEKVDAIIETPPSETEIDLEFLYTRDIEFRQETAQAEYEAGAGYCLQP